MKLHTIETGFFHSDGGAMFGLLPKTHWSKFYPSGKNNLCRLAMRCFILEWPGHKILIDTGVGLRHLHKLKAYRFEEVIDLTRKLQSIGISPDEITDVVLSHLHFDHCGQATRLNDKGTSEINFPQATYHVSKTQWERSLNPSALDRNAYFSDNLAAVTENKKLHLIENSYTIAPCFHIECCDGHTPGQLICFFDDGHTRYLYPGDAIPMALHVRSECLSAFDLNADEACLSKNKILQRAVDEERTLLFYHDAFTWGARIKRSGTFFRIKETVIPPAV